LQDTEGELVEPFLNFEIAYSMFPLPALPRSSEIYTNVITLFKKLKIAKYMAQKINQKKQLININQKNNG